MTELKEMIKALADQFAELQKGNALTTRQQ